MRPCDAVWSKAAGPGRGAGLHRFLLLTGLAAVLAGCGGNNTGSYWNPNDPPTPKSGNPDFFAGVSGSGTIPSAGRAALVSDSPEASPVADAYPDKATFTLSGIQFVDAKTIRGLVRYTDPKGGLVTTPRDFSDTGRDYPTRLVSESGTGVTVESQSLAYYAAGYRNEPFHERSWWAVCAGKARVNGVDGYTFAVYIDDARDPSNPNDTRTGRDYFAIAIYAPEKPYGWSPMTSGVQRWGVSGVVYYNQYYLQQGDIRAVGTPTEPANPPR